MKHNVLSKSEYGFSSLFWASIWFIWYKIMLFSKLEEHNYNFSVLCLLFLLGGSLLANYRLTCSWYRTKAGAISACIIPLCIYTCLAYRPQIGKPVFIALYVSLLLTVLFLLCVFFRKRKSTAIKWTRLMWNRTKIGFIGVRTIATMCSLFIMLTLFTQIKIMGLAEEVKEETATTERVEYTIQEHMDLLENLMPEKWDSLSIPQKREVMQAVVNEEASSLKISDPIELIPVSLSNATLASYDDEKSVIYLNIRHLANGSSYEVLTSICHEAYHAAQWSYVKIYSELDAVSQSNIFLKDAKRYMQELQDYKTADTAGFDDYYSQTLECDARDYSVAQMEQILEKIYTYREMEMPAKLRREIEVYKRHV